MEESARILLLGVPAKDMSKSLSVVTVNIILFGNRLFADIIKLRILR